jgi:ABC-2 type transport system ATP-binding protein
MRNAGKTIVLVTHDTGAVQEYCDRAMLIHDGVSMYMGDPEEVGRRYLQLNFANEAGPNVGLKAADVHARVLDAWLEDDEGARQENLDGHQPIRLNAIIEARERLENVVVAFHLYDVRGVHILGFNYSRHEAGDGAPDVLEEGRRLRVRVELENRLAKGHYYVKCWVARDRQPGDLKVQVFDLLDFVVYNVEPIAGLIDVDPVVSSELVG